MIRVTGIDHLSIRVSDFARSKRFYEGLFKFMGFRVLNEYEDTIGWTNGHTRYWIGQAKSKFKHKTGDVGFHHYAFQLRSRKDVDALQAYLRRNKVKIVDRANEYYPDYYAVFFSDPDGLKLEGMHYGKKINKKL